jgi:hypothetical protein
VTTPRVEYLRQLDTHRLIPARHSGDAASVHLRIADNEQHLQGVLDLDSATDARLRAEIDLLPGIGTDELVFGIPHHRLINAAFIHANPFGSRFNGPERGAWYAGFELETSQAEVAWHKSVEFSEIGWFQESVAYDDYLADFAGEYHDIREAPAFANCLEPDSYEDSQALAETLLAAGSSGIVYPSVRRKGGVCLVCFRPALVGNVRRRARYRFTWTGTPEPTISLDETYA